MAMDNRRRRPPGHEIIVISDDSEDDDDVVDVAIFPPKHIGQPRRDDNPDPIHWDSDGDSSMQDYVPRNDQRQLEFLPAPPRALPQPDPGAPIVPVVQIPPYDPFADPFVANPSPVRQQGLKRKRSVSPLDRLPEKRAGVGDREPAFFPINLPQERLGRERERRMFKANVPEDGFGEPLLAGPFSDAPSANNAAAAAAESPRCSRDGCLREILAMFPDMSPEHVSALWDTKQEHRSIEGLVDLIIQDLDAGRLYPKIVKVAPAIRLKQKQASDNGNDPAKRYLARNRPSEEQLYKSEVKTYLSADFPWMPMNMVTAQLAAVNFFLYPAYLACYELERKWAPEQPQYTKLKKARPLPAHLTPANVDLALNGALATPAVIVPIMQELRDARAAKRRLKTQYDREAEGLRVEKENEEAARATGTIEDCACCFSEYPLNRMVHCNNEASIHFFCKTCAKTNAETEVGQGKYHLVCMSMDGCSAGFSREQRDLFVDSKLKIALERIETEHNLRMAGIENLESCPFCPYAAEYPPIADTRIFRCVHPECGIESCRLCKKVSHIPKTCPEFAKESGADSHRRRLEDAMSEALVRKCNKCKTPFIKTDGCNKITCTKCRNVQCYICSEDCVAGPNGSSYIHFNDPSRGGKEGQCQLFDNTEQRHQEQVDAAQKEAMAKIRAEHPEYSEEELKATITETTAAKEDRERRARLDPMAARYGVAGYGIEVIFREAVARRGAGEELPQLLRPLGQQGPPWAVERVAGGEPRLRPPRARRNGFAAYPGLFDDNWAVFGEAPPIPPVRNLAWNPVGDPAPLPGVRIHQWLAAPQPFIVQNPPPPPPPATPAIAIENERNLAQDHALRDAYKSAPPEVQARRREQMRRMMKDPTLDDATVERAILQVGEFAEVVEGGLIALGRPEMDRASRIFDRLQGRGEQRGARRARRPTPPPPHPMDPHPEEPFPAFDAPFPVENYQRDVHDPIPGLPARPFQDIINDFDGALASAERLADHALQQIILAPSPDAEGMNDRHPILNEPIAWQVQMIAQPVNNGDDQRPPDNFDMDINRLLEEIYEGEGQLARALFQEGGDPNDRARIPEMDLDLLGIDSESDSGDEDDIDLYQQLGQAQTDVEVKMRRLEERRQAQPPPAPRLQPVRGPFDATPDRRDGELANQPGERLRPRNIPHPRGAGVQAAPAACPRGDAMASRPRLNHYYHPAISPRNNPNPYVALYAPPSAENRAPSQQLRDEVGAHAEMDLAEAGNRGRIYRLRERNITRLNERAEAKNDPIHARLREEQVVYQQRHQDALREEHDDQQRRQQDAVRENFARQMRMRQDARNEESKLRQNMRRTVDTPPLAENEDAPVRPGHRHSVMGGESARLNNMIAEGEDRMLHQGGAGGVRVPWRPMPPMPRRLVAQHGREVIWNANPAAGAQRPIAARPKIGDEGLDDDVLFMMNTLVPVLPSTRRPSSPRCGRARSSGAPPSTPSRQTPAPTQRQNPLNPGVKSLQPGRSAVFQRIGKQLDDRESGDWASNSSMVRPGVDMQISGRRHGSSGTEEEKRNVIDLGSSDEEDENLFDLRSPPPSILQQGMRRVSIDDGHASHSPPPRQELELENEEQEELAGSPNENDLVISADEEEM